MLNFVKSAFRGGLEVVLWINLILWTICGGIVGNNIRGDDYIFLGIIIGIMGGLLINIIGGGFIATILNMDANLDKLVKGNLPSEVTNVNSTENQVRLHTHPSGDEYLVSVYKVKNMKKDVKKIA